MMKTLVTLALAVVAATVASTPALAQPTAAQAEALFRQGRDLFAAGKVAEACAAFEQSQKLDPAVTTLINLAGCRDKNGQIATAWGLFIDVERQTREGTDPLNVQLHKVAHDNAVRLEALHSLLTIHVPAGSKIAGLAVDRDGEHIDPGLWNLALPIDGGTYTIVATAPGFAPWRSTVVIAPEHDAKTVEIPDLRAPSPAPADHRPVVAIAPPPVVVVAEPFHASTALVIGAGAASAALLGTALAFDLLGDAKYADARAETADLSRRAALEHDANTRRHVAAIAGGVGLAASVATLVLYVSSRGAPGEKPLAAGKRRVVVSPTGIALIGAF